MAEIPQDVILEIRSRVDLVELVGERIKLRRTGRQFRGPCPLHGGEGPNFAVDPGKGLYNCFVCGEGGDAIRFLEKLDGLPFRDAVKALGERVGVAIPEDGDGPREDPHTGLRDAMELAWKWFREQMDGDAGAEARAYLESRGHTARPVMEGDPGIGYAPDGEDAMMQHLKGAGVTVQQMLTLGLVQGDRNHTRYWDAYRNRLIFPIHDVRGRLVALAGRVMPGAPEHAPKYVNSPENPIYTKGRHLYGLHLARGPIRRQGWALLVEGYMDWRGLVQAGLQNVVAGSGTALTEGQATLLARHCPEVVTFYDGDRAGKAATFKAGLVLLEAGLRTRCIVRIGDAGGIGPEEDPDTVARSVGEEGVVDLVTRAPDVFEAVAEELRLRGFFATLTGRQNALEKLLPVVRAAGDEVVRAMYVRRLAELTGVSAATLGFGATDEERPADQLQRDLEEVRAALAVRDRAIRQVVEAADSGAELDGGSVLGLLREALDPKSAVDFLRYVSDLERRVDEQGWH